MPERERKKKKKKKVEGGEEGEKIGTTKKRSVEQINQEIRSNGRKKAKTR